VAINGGSMTLVATVATGMATGTYLDLLTGDSVTVDSAGAVQLNLTSRTALAIDVATKIP
jgi:hypothetical protein